MQITKCWKSVNACVHTVCMNPRAGKSDPMCLSVKLCTLITCLQSFYFTRSHHITGTIRFIFMLESQLYARNMLYFLIELLNCCDATSRHTTFMLWHFAPSLCITTRLFYHSPTYTPATAIKEEKSFIRAVSSRGYIMLGCCWPECLTLGYSPAVRSLQLCLGSQSWTLPLRFKCLSTSISKVLTATIY